MGKIVTKQITTNSAPLDYEKTKSLLKRLDIPSRDTNNIAGFKNHTILPEPEIRELVRRYQATGDVAARNRVIEHNLKFVWSVVCTCISPKSKEFTNVFNATIVDMEKAVDRFDLDRAKKDNVKFTSYAVWWIRRAISNYFSTVMPMLRLPASEVRKLRAERIAYLEETNPEAKELAVLRKRQRGNATYDAVSMLQQSELNEDSIFYSEEDAEDDTYPSGASTLEAADRSTLVKDLIGSLPDRERYVIEKSYALNGACEQSMPLTAIGRSLTPPISKERVRQLRDQGFSRIRKQLSSQHIELHDVV